MQDFFTYTIKMPVYIGIAKSDHTKTKAFKICGSNRVFAFFAGCIVLGTV